MRKVLVTKSAKKDLHQIWHFIAQDSVEAANKVINALNAGVTQIAEMPGIGHPRRDVGYQTYRFWKVYSYLIAYRMHSRTLVVSRVVHAARNLSKVFKHR